jgi:hypothetical protein
MTCESTRQRLLRSERPDRPPADVQPHLAACAACRGWQRRLTRIERQIPELPVPSSEPPAALIRQILAGPPPLPGGPVPGLNAGSPWWVNNPMADRNQPGPIDRSRFDPTYSRHNERARRKVAVAFAMTLGLAAFSLSWGLWPHPPSPTQPAQTAGNFRQARLERLLIAARTPKERVNVLAKYADDLKREALAMVRTSEPEELRELATLYVQVVHVRLPNYARTLPAAERVKVLEEVTKGLSETNSDISRLLTEDVSPAIRVSLSEIAQAALDGHNRLRELLREV